MPPPAQPGAGTKLEAPSPGCPQPRVKLRDAAGNGIFHVDLGRGPGRSSWVGEALDQAPAPLVVVRTGEGKKNAAIEQVHPDGCREAPACCHLGLGLRCEAFPYMWAWGRFWVWVVVALGPAKKTFHGPSSRGNPTSLGPPPWGSCAPPTVVGEGGRSSWVARFFRRARFRTIEVRKFVVEHGPAGRPTVRTYRSPCRTTASGWNRPCRRQGGSTWRTVTGRHPRPGKENPAGTQLSWPGPLRSRRSRFTYQSGGRG